MNRRLEHVKRGRSQATAKNSSASCRHTAQRSANSVVSCFSLVYVPFPIVTGVLFCVYTKAKPSRGQITCNGQRLTQLIAGSLNSTAYFIKGLAQ